MELPHINVYKKRKTIFGREKNVAVLQIGFPGWKSQVKLKAFKEVMKAIGVNSGNGIDIKMFLNGNEPMYKLIEDYEGPLSRLKDK